MKYIFNIFRVLSIVCYLMIFVFMVIEIPIVFGYKPEIVLTGSMTPTYPVGSVIYYKQSKFEDININDVITFDLGQSIVTHRVVEKHDNTQSFLTKGDANISVDQNEVYYNQVQGKVGLICIYYVGNVIIFFQNNIWISIIMACILIIYYIMCHHLDKLNYANKDINSNIE